MRHRLEDIIIGSTELADDDNDDDTYKLMIIRQRIARFENGSISARRRVGNRLPYPFGYNYGL